jgi:hypothetical protein
MAKRFTDNNLWEKEWFQDLPNSEKLAWFYIKDRCDSAGVWKPNRRAAEFFIGEKIDWEGFAERCNGNILVIDKGKWWLVDFCDFQYGKLTENCRPHRWIIATLEKHGLLERVLERYGNPTDALKAKGREKEAEPRTQYTPAFERFWDAYPKRRRQGKGDAFRTWKRDKPASRVDEIIAKVEAYKRTRDWTKDDGQYIPAPAVFLNGKRYDDEPEKQDGAERPRGTLM